MTAVTVPFVDLPAVIRPSKAEYLAAFERLLDTGGFIGGPAVADFEAGFARHCGAPHVIAVRTGCAITARPGATITSTSATTRGSMRLRARALSISLARLDAGNSARRRLAAHHRARLAELPGVRLVTEPAGSSLVHHLMVIRVDAARRDQIRDRLAAAGSATAIHYPRPIHLQRAYAHLGQGPGSCPVAERAANEMISLPRYPDLTVAQVDQVADALAAAVA